MYRRNFLASAASALTIFPAVQRPRQGRAVRTSRRPTATDVRTALATYQKAIRRAEIASAVYYRNPDDGPGGDGVRHASMEHAVSDQIAAERHLAELVAAVAGKPSENRLSVVTLEGVSVVAYLSDDDELRAGIGNAPHVVELATG
jgi:hypothetical protein